MVKKTKKLDQLDMADCFGWKQSHGGKRDGAGRPKGKTQTQVMRVPVELVDEVKELINKHKQEVRRD
ncbi:hypothetical protein BCT97_018415 [Vibrio breoganii]|uniref:hypothetical protein n=1 Tax=Vibrio TaxID=662 RepID=UPI001054D36E|nr:MULTISPECIES: hypothetical protein [Vibrio]